MSLYECVGIARQDISSAQVDNLIEGYKQVISDMDGNLVDVEYWGVKTLAYKMNKNRKGHYFMLKVDAPAAAMQEVERLMRFNEDMLRSLTLRVDEFEDGPSIQMRVSKGRDRGERGDRGDRGGDRGDRRPRDGTRDGGRDGGRDNGRDGSPKQEASEGARS